MTYEFELKHRLTGKSAVVQVKSGWTALNIDDYDKLDTDIFYLLLRDNITEHQNQISKPLTQTKYENFYTNKHTYYQIK